MPPLDVPEWGGVVLMRELSGLDRDAVVHSDSPVVMFAIRSLVDTSGKRLFDDSDFHALSLKSSAAIYRIAVAGFDRNGLARGSVDRLRTRLEESPERKSYFLMAKELHMTVNRFLAETTSEQIAEYIALSHIQAEERENADDSTYSQPIRAMGMK